MLLSALLHRSVLTVSQPTVAQRKLLRGRIPVLEVTIAPRPTRAVLVCHGLGAYADVQRPELERLARAGYLAVGLDAPHHGSRRDQWLDAMAAARPPESQVLLVGLVREAVAEVSLAIDELLGAGCDRVALLGVSMGAYTALAAATEDARVSATVSLLGSPDWAPRTGPVNDELRSLMSQAPAARPPELLRHPVLLVNAALDEHVPARLARAFARNVAERHPELAPRLAYVEYPESGHFMREQDWHDAWAHALGFLGEHLR